MSPLEIIAPLIFLAFWLGYEPVMRLRPHSGGELNANMVHIRAAWMLNMSRREARFIDSQLMGHVINSASFFASSNLILIAALTSALVGGQRTFNTLHGLPWIERTAPLLFEVKLALIVLALARGLLDFIWSIRQMNYCLAAIGAAPMLPSEAQAAAYGEATASILNPALSTFSSGVRGYYFALGAAGWLLGPLVFIAVMLSTMALLIWRQLGSPSARGVRRLRDLLDAAQQTPGEP
jgi:uncharacterized membrane protein